MWEIVEILFLFLHLSIKVNVGKLKLKSGTCSDFFFLGFSIVFIMRSINHLVSYLCRVAYQFSVIF